MLTSELWAYGPRPPSYLSISMNFFGPYVLNLHHPSFDSNNPQEQANAAATDIICLGSSDEVRQLAQQMLRAFPSPVP